MVGQCASARGSLDSRPLRVVVTGASGQLGRMLAQQLCTGGAEQKGDVIGYQGDAWHFLQRDRFDITDAQGVLRTLRELQPDVVVNCAAYTKVDQAEGDAALANAINAEGVRALLRATEGLGRGPLGCMLIHISTDYVFGGQGNTPHHESSVARPQCVYGQSKREGELALLGHGRALVLRTGWLYSHYPGNFFTTILLRCLAGAPLRVVYDQVGGPTWAGNLAGIIIRIVTERLLASGLYHCSDLGVASWYDFAVAIRRAANCNNNITPIRSNEYSQRALRPTYSVLDGAQTREALGYEGMHWLDALGHCFDLWRAANATG